MKIRNVLQSLLISALVLGGLGIATAPTKAQQVHPDPDRTAQIHDPHRRSPIISHAQRAHAKRPKRSQRKRSRPATNRFTTVNNHIRDLRNAKWEANGTGRPENVKSISGPKVTFRTLRFIPAHIRDIHFIQSIAVAPNGRSAYLGGDAYPYLSGYTRIIRVNLNRRSGGIETGRRFYGGHGQALAYNPKNRQLWLLVDPSGPLHRGKFDQISTSSLKPIRHVNFSLNHADLGDVLAFDNHGNAYNENRIWNWNANKRFKPGNILLFKGSIARHRADLRLIKQGIRKAPGYIIQGIAYNPRTGRLYIETDDAIMSVPANRLGKLRPRDVRETILSGHREYEGISFDKKGYAYIVMARPSEILKSTRVF